MFEHEQRMDRDASGITPVVPPHVPVLQTSCTTPVRPPPCSAQSNWTARGEGSAV